MSFDLKLFEFEAKKPYITDQSKEI